ncbi:MAG: Hpt domain-containing protein [Ruminiclostridium sp.]|nr:Hpt domain-containing protein [Ruminiclostridium sp.]
MLTADNLRAYGANVDEGISRCLDDEEFYIDLVKSVIPDERIDELEKCIANKDFDKAFEVAHALKGMYGNISITPIYEPVSEITELLRERKDTDYSAYLEQAKEQKRKLVELYNARK